ncbi:MAG: hypothetical protein M5U20_12735 [Phycisphaerales bacterium]|nr:hypothetical protein [Phycisphaerales bacterium]
MMDSPYAPCCIWLVSRTTPPPDAALMSEREKARSWEGASRWLGPRYPMTSTSAPLVRMSAARGNPVPLVTASRTALASEFSSGEALICAAHSMRSSSLCWAIERSSCWGTCWTRCPVEPKSLVVGRVEGGVRGADAEGPGADAEEVALVDGRGGVDFEAHAVDEGAVAAFEVGDEPGVGAEGDHGVSA